MPNKQDGLGFARIMSLPEGASVFGIWCLILQACSRQAAPRQGYLTDTGVSSGCPWTISDLSMRWRRSEAEVAHAIDILSSQGVGWIRVYESTDTTRIPQGYHEDTSVSLVRIGLDRTGQDRTGPVGGLVEIDPDSPENDPSAVLAPQPLPPPTKPKVSFLDWVSFGHPRVNTSGDSSIIWRNLWDQYAPVDNRDEVFGWMYDALIKNLDQPRFKIWPNDAQEWLMKNCPIPKGES